MHHRLEIGKPQRVLLEASKKFPGGDGHWPAVAAGRYRDTAALGSLLSQTAAAMNYIIILQNFCYMTKTSLNIMKPCRSHNAALAEEAI